MSPAYLSGSRGNLTLHLGHTEYLASPALAPAPDKDAPAAGQAALVALPLHDPCGLNGAGRPDTENVVVCSTVRTFEMRGEKLAPVDRPGCGLRFALCHGCGLRSVRDRGACASCGGGEL